MCVADVRKGGGRFPNLGDTMEIMVCIECLHGIVNDDYTGLDLIYDEDAAAMKADLIRHSIENLGGYACLGDSDKDEEFSRNACECCGDEWAGARFHIVVME